MKQYLLKTCWVLALVVASAALLVYVVDPLGVFHDEQSSLYPNKPKLHSRARVAKPTKIYHKKPDLIILGSSRSELGLNPAAIPNNHFNAFNSAVSGATMGDILAFYKHASLVSDPKMVIIGVDYFMFNGSTLRERTDPAFMAFDEHNERKWYYGLSSLVFNLLSTDLVKAAWKTIRDQSTVNHQTRDNGHRSDERVYNHNKKEGFRSKFDITEYAYISTIWWDCDINYRIVPLETPEAVTTPEGMHYLQQLLVDAKQHGRQVKLVISPPHARLLAELKRSGVWDEFMAWRLAMVELVNQVDPEGQSVELYDFMVDNPYMFEPTTVSPGEGMEWFIDSTHYRENMGNLILARIFGEQNGFGRPVQGNAMPQHNALLTASIDEFIHNHPEEMLDQERFEKAMEARKLVQKQCNQI